MENGFRYSVVSSKSVSRQACRTIPVTIQAIVLVPRRRVFWPRRDGSEYTATHLPDCDKVAHNVPGGGHGLSSLSRRAMP